MKGEFPVSRMLSARDGNEIGITQLTYRLIGNQCEDCRYTIEIQDILFQINLVSRNNFFFPHEAIEGQLKHENGFYFCTQLNYFAAMTLCLNQSRRSRYEAF